MRSVNLSGEPMSLSGLREVKPAVLLSSQIEIADQTGQSVILLMNAESPRCLGMQYISFMYMLLEGKVNREGSRVTIFVQLGALLSSQLRQVRRRA